MHLTVSKVLPGEKVLTLEITHLAILGLISTNLVPPWRVNLELLCCCNLFSNKRYEFVVSVGTSCTVVQEELLMLLMIMFPKALLGLLLTPPTVTIYPETFWKSTLPSPETRTLSSRPSLWSSLNILFCVLGEVISLSLWHILDFLTGRSEYPCLRLLSLNFFLILENLRGIPLFLYTIFEGWRLVLSLIF